MRTATYLLALLAALLVVPAAHATEEYLAQYSSGSGSYLSEYSSGGNRYYNPTGSGYIRSGLTSGAGSIDRTAAHHPIVVIVQSGVRQAPCGIYSRAPVSPCRMVTMAYNPDATVSRTRGGFNIPPLSSLPPYFNRTVNGFRNNWISPVDE